MSDEQNEHSASNTSYKNIKSLKIVLLFRLDYIYYDRRIHINIFKYVENQY